MCGKRTRSQPVPVLPFPLILSLASGSRRPAPPADLDSSPPVPPPVMTPSAGQRHLVAESALHCQAQRDGKPPPACRPWVVSPPPAVKVQRTRHRGPSLGDGSRGAPCWYCGPPPLPVLQRVRPRRPVLQPPQPPAPRPSRPLHVWWFEAPGHPKRCPSRRGDSARPPVPAPR